MPKVELLIELLRKISKTGERVHIDVDYNGREFSWKLPKKDVTAEEFIPGRFGTRRHED